MQWFYKKGFSLQNLYSLFYAETIPRVPCRHPVWCEVARKTISIFIYDDILVYIATYIYIYIYNVIVISHYE